MGAQPRESPVEVSAGQFELDELVEPIDALVTADLVASRSKEPVEPDAASGFAPPTPANSRSLR
jgi:hypothetical protein